MVKTEQKIRRSAQKDAILKILAGKSVHRTADEVYQQVRVSLPRISLGTVYRNLEKLVQEGQIQAIDTRGAPRCFDGNPVRHLHVRCRSCGRIEDVAEFPQIFSLDQVQREIATDFQVDEVEVDLVGLCPQCREA